MVARLELIGAVAITVACVSCATIGPRSQGVPASSQVQAASSYFPLTEGSWSFRRTVARESRPVAVHVTRLTCDSWRWTVEAVRRVDLRVSEDRSIHVLSEEELEEGVRVSYEPALMLLPGVMEGGRVYESQSQMIVQDLADGRERDRGDVTLSVRLVEGAVESHRRIDLSLADVQVLTRLWRTDQQVMTHQQIERTTRVAGLFTTQRVEVLRLQAP